MKKINISNLAIITIYYLSFICLLFLKWYKNIDIVSEVLSIGILIYLLLNYKNINIKKSDILLLFLFILLILFNLLLTNEHPYFFDSIFKDTFIPFLSILFVNALIKNNDVLKKYILNPSFIILNIFYIINLYIIMKQIDNPSFMLRNYTTNTFYIDHIAGLLGANGTHKLAFFYILLLYLNMVFFDSKNKLTRSISKLMFIFILITSCYTSIYNDNRMYYFLLIIYLFPFFVSKNKKSNNIYSLKINGKKAIKYISTLLIVISTFLYLYNFNEKFNEIVKVEIYEKYIEKTINRMNSSVSDSNEKKEERVELLKYSLNNSSMFGNGIGCIPKGGDSSVPKHFGLNEANIRIYTGGIFYFLLIIIIYTKGYFEMINKKNIKQASYIFITLIITCLYFQPFLYSVQSILVGTVYMLYAYLINKKEVELI